MSKNNDNTVSKLQCVSYAPFTKDQSPYMFEDGMIIGEEQVRKDCITSAQYTIIRTYSTIGLMIPKVARETGLVLLMGAWVMPTKMTHDWNLMRLFDLVLYVYPDVVNAVIVVETRSFYEAIPMPKSYENNTLNYVKKGFLNTKVTYADVWGVLGKIKKSEKLQTLSLFTFCRIGK